MSEKELYKFILYEREILNFCEQNSDKANLAVNMLINCLVKFYISCSNDDEALIRNVQDCFDHYQEILNRKGMKLDR